jgi:hypothetical protein
LVFLAVTCGYGRRETDLGMTAHRNGSDGDGANTDAGLYPRESHEKQRIRHGTGRIVAAIANFIEWVCGREIF